MTGQYSDEELSRLINDANERAFEGRLERLRFMFSVEDPNPAPASSLSYAYYEEARLCWFIGAFVATILMSQLAFEEMLRSLFRVANGVGGQISTKKNVNDAGFSDLINQAKHEDLITLEEANALHLIRKSYRNPYVHSHDVNVKPNFSTQEMKIFAPTLVEASVEDEARTTIRILVNLFPKISRRFWGQ